MTLATQLSRWAQLWLDSDSKTDSEPESHPKEESLQDVPIGDYSVEDQLGGEDGIDEENLGDRAVDVSINIPGDKQ